MAETLRVELQHVEQFWPRQARHAEDAMRDALLSRNVEAA